MWLQSLLKALGLWGEIMDNAAPLPKKRFSLRGNLLRLRMLLILVLVAIVAFTAWQQLSPQTYSFFTSYLDYATSPDAFAVAVESFRYGFETNPIARSLELFILALCLWKLVFRGGILASLSIKSIVMVSLSILWIDLVLFRLVDITRFPLWYYYWAFMAYSLPSTSTSILWRAPTLCVYASLHHASSSASPSQSSSSLRRGRGSASQAPTSRGWESMRSWPRSTPSASC